MGFIRSAAYDVLQHDYLISQIDSAERGCQDADIKSSCRSGRLGSQPRFESLTLVFWPLPRPLNIMRLPVTAHFAIGHLNSVRMQREEADKRPEYYLASEAHCMTVTDCWCHYAPRR